MVTKVQKWGNSQGVRLSRELLAQAAIEVGDVVDVAVRDGLVVITPARRVRGGRSLEKLVARVPADYVPDESDWGPPAGAEVW